MIKTYIRVELSSEGESPKQVIERMRRIGAVPVVGDYDFELTLDEDKRLFDKLEEIHHALRGASVRYMVTTRTDVDAEVGTRQAITHYVDQRPIELKKALYKAKLERWRDMGLDVSELEVLLEEDLEHFKDASKQFLRTHLDSLSVIKDKRPADNKVDGEVLGLMDEQGKTLQQLMAATGHSEEQVLLSLGRLMSADSVKRVQTDSQELYTLIPPPAPPPQLRKAIQMAPAKDDEEARKRLLEAIPSEGILAKDLIRSAKLPREQFMKALSELMTANAVRKEHKGKRDLYFKA